MKALKVEAEFYQGHLVRSRSSFPNAEVLVVVAVACAVAAAAVVLSQVSSVVC